MIPGLSFVIRRIVQSAAKNVSQKIAAKRAKSTPGVFQPYIL